MILNTLIGTLFSRYTWLTYANNATNLAIYAIIAK